MKCKIEVVSRELKVVKDEVVELNIADRAGYIALGDSLLEGNWCVAISVEVEYKRVYGELTLYCRNANETYSGAMMSMTCNGKTI